MECAARDTESVKNFIRIKRIKDFESHPGKP